MREVTDKGKCVSLDNRQCTESVKTARGYGLADGRQ
jgi:hypothetical protein